MKYMTKNNQLTAQIHLYKSANTPLGRLYWDPKRLGLACLAAALGGTVGLVGGAALSLQLGGGLIAALMSLLGSALGALTMFLANLKA
jgi:hypothetical protein